MAVGLMEGPPGEAADASRATEARNMTAKCVRQQAME
jgi:hypothetical protein